MIYLNVSVFIDLVVTQVYEANVGVDYAIKGNSIVVKCGIPSFVADFVNVVSWHTDKGDDIYHSDNYGTLRLNTASIASLTVHSRIFYSSLFIHIIMEI